MGTIENPHEVGSGLAWRFPETGTIPGEVGSEMVVRDDEVAVLLLGGQARATFGAGRHVLTAQDLLPVGGAAGAGEVEVYFVNTSDCLPVKWGTPKPLRMPPAAPAGSGEVRSFGLLEVQIGDPWRFIVRLVEELGARQPAEIQDQVRVMVVQTLAVALEELNWSISETPQSCQEVTARMLPRLREPLAAAGIALKSLAVEGITLLEPEETGQPGGVPLPSGAPLPQEPEGLVLDRGAWPSFQFMEMMQASMAATGQPATQPVEILDVAQAAAYLQRTEAEVLVLIEAGEIQAKHIGSGYRVTKQRLDEWLSRHKQE